MKPDTATIDAMYRPQLITLVNESDPTAYPIFKLRAMSVEELRAIAHALPDTAPPPPTPKPAAPSATSTTTGTGGLGALLEALKNDLAPAVMAEILPEVTRIAEGRPRAVEITIKSATAEKKLDLGITHEQFPAVLRYALADIPVYLYGPAGSGKSTVAVQLARALTQHYGREIPDYLTSFGPASQAWELLGLPDIHNPGKKRTPEEADTEFRRAWVSGGVILLDEFDASSEVMVVLNNALANGRCVFADGQRLERHPDCRIIAAGNTTMNGATDQYTSRNRIDAATKNRFIAVAWDYDPALELHAAGEDQRAWVENVQAYRAALKSLGTSASADLLITPRASIYGARILRMFPDTPWAQLEADLIWQGCPDDEREKVQSARRKMKKK